MVVVFFWGTKTDTQLYAGNTTYGSVERSPGGLGGKTRPGSWKNLPFFCFFFMSGAFSENRKIAGGKCILFATFRKNLVPTPWGSCAKLQRFALK